MSIEQLAERSGATTRNIRNYQTLGLLPRPALSGRVGVYDDGHLARLRLIDQLQQHGFSLAGIGRLLAAWEEGRTLADVLGFEAVLTAPWTDEQPVVVDLAHLLAQFPEAVTDPSLSERAVAAGLLRFEGDKVRVSSPRLVHVGAQLVRSGVPLGAILDELATLTAELDAIAARFVALFDRYQWQPFAAAGMPAERVPEVTAALERMRPLAQATVEVVLAQAMARHSAENTALRMTPVRVDPDDAAPSPVRRNRKERSA